MERKDIQSIWAAYQEVQEKKLKGDQHKLDMDKDGDIDATDFKHMRDKKKVAKEEVENLDELSNKTLGSYIKKAKDSYAGAATDLSRNSPGHKDPERKKIIGKFIKRNRGIDKAVDKMAKESVELDEAFEFYVRLDHLDGDKRMKGAVDLLKKYEKSKKNDFESETDKGFYFYAKSKSDISKLDRELKKFATGAQMTEAVEEAKDPRQSNRGYQDSNDKGLSPGGKQMKADMQKGAKYDDTEEKGHQDAAKFGKKMKASPMRNNDNSQGDKNNNPSATKVKEAKTIDAFFRALIDKEGNA